MRSLRETLKEAKAGGWAIGHFNISELAALKGIIAAAKSLDLPVMIGLSEGEREFIGLKESVALIRSIREESGLAVYLNADHTHSLEKIEAAARAGFDEVIADFSKLPMEENIRETKKAVQLVRSINPEMIVEGEIGYIGSSSEILEAKPEGLELSTPEEAKRFVEETGVDVLAPAVGNMHGLLAAMVSGDLKKRLDIERIKAIALAAGGYLTLHGGSGTADDDFKEAIKAGVTIVHVSTELRLAWRRGLEAGLAKDPGEVAPYKILPEVVRGVEAIVTDRLKLFAGR